MNEDFHISGTAADECELFERIRGGDEQAFTLVYERYHGMLYSLALRMIKQTGAAESRDIDRRLGEAIDRLPRQQRAVIMMKRDGCSNREIAEKLHVSINTVKTHYADGLRSLRLSIGPIIKMITLLVMIRSL